jgi:stage II sporulation protein M
VKDIYNNYKKELSKKNSILFVIVVIFIIGLIFGSIYITILKDSGKSLVLKEVNNYFLSLNKISFSDKIEIFKNSLISNLLYFIFMWLLGISVIGVPIIIIMIFFKSFVVGFSVSSIFAKYGFKAIIGAFLYIFPSSVVTSIITLILGAYSLILSFKIIKGAFIKRNINFKTFMGKYFFLLLISILVSILCSLYDAFVNPSILKLFTNLIK